MKPATERNADKLQAGAYTRRHATIPTGSLPSDAPSVIFTDYDGKRRRLPKGDVAFDPPAFGGGRIAREVATKRDLLNAHGTFYELPANNPHILRASDGKARLWAGAIDEIWKLGNPRVEDGPWHQTKVKANQPSHSHLLTGYDKKSLQLRLEDPHNETLNITAQIDIHGDGSWVDYQSFALKTGETTPMNCPPPSLPSGSTSPATKKPPPRRP